MRPTKSSKTNRKPLRRWEPPAVAKLAVGTQTKVARDQGQSEGSKNSGSVRSRLAHPQRPAAPSTKLGFSFEMSFPLSARTEK